MTQTSIIIPEPVSIETLVELAAGRECIISHGEAESTCNGARLPVIILDFVEGANNDHSSRFATDPACG